MWVDSCVRTVIRWICRDQCPPSLLHAFYSLSCTDFSHMRLSLSLALSVFLSSSWSHLLCSDPNRYILKCLRSDMERETGRLNEIQHDDSKSYKATRT